MKNLLGGLEPGDGEESPLVRGGHTNHQLQPTLQVGSATNVSIKLTIHGIIKRLEEISQIKIFNLN